MPLGAATSCWHDGTVRPGPFVTGQEGHHSSHSLTSLLLVAYRPHLRTDEDIDQVEHVLVNWVKYGLDMPRPIRMELCRVSTGCWVWEHSLQGRACISWQLCRVSMGKEAHFSAHLHGALQGEPVQLA